MNLFKQMGKNWTKNTKSKALGESGKKAAYTLLGGMLYTVIPTAIQGWGGVDMSGAKGVMAGAVGSSVVGLLADKKEIVAGGLATAGIHLAYNHLNGVITGIFGSPIFGYSPGAVQYTDEKQVSETMNDALPAGYGYNSMGEIVALDLPGNQEMIAQEQPVNDYTSELNDYTTSLNDYTSSLGIDGFGGMLTKDLAANGLIFS